MKYRVNPKNGDELSALAFGCMRLPRNEKEAKKLVVTAVESGVNYFDTAYMYPNNEVLLGRILPKEYREKVKIATKLPPYLVRKTEDFDKIFNAELERLQTGYIDYYLVHMLPNTVEWSRLIGLGILDWIKQKKESGKIRNIGFSYHGNFDEFKKLIDAYDWEFCMLQYNYFDENNQAGRKGVSYASEKGLPVMIMEPLRGGSLASKLPKEAVRLFESYTVKRSPAEWALRWVLNQPEASTVLSGMNTPEALEENLRIASEMEAGTLTAEELAACEKARRIILDSLHVGCTGCGYCVPCPRGVDIPLCFSSYNDMAAGIKSKLKTKFQYILHSNGHNASLCTKCGKCEKHCPQSIAIRDELAAAAKVLEGPLYKPMRFAVKKFMKLD